MLAYQTIHQRSSGRRAVLALGLLLSLALMALLSPDIGGGEARAGGPAAGEVSAPGVENAAPDLLADFGKMPLYFIENEGQLDERVAYYLQGSDKTLYFTAEGVTFSFRKYAPAEVAAKGPEGLGNREQVVTAYTLKLDFIGANPGVQPVGEAPYEARIAYFKGSPDEWQTGLPTYARLRYPDLWPGIDLVYYGTANELKYEFIVKPGANPQQIRLAYRGATGLGVTEAGQLAVQTPVETFHDEIPYAYQEINGQRVTVPAAYALASPQEPSATAYSFHLGQYDPTHPLVLDPAVLIYAGFIGGSGLDYGTDIAVDSAGNVYVTGFTDSTEATFPETAGPDMTYNGGNSDAFVAKVKADGTGLVYAGYIGGDNEDVGYGIAVDGDGNAYITGYTNSTEDTFPVYGIGGLDYTHNGGYDAFVAVVNDDDGIYLYPAGYIGGSGDDYGYSIAVDTAGHIYITGSTHSTEATFPSDDEHLDYTHNGGADAFVAKVASGDGYYLDYAGYVGGSGDDNGSEITLDSAGNVYITGSTSSTEATFPVVGGPDLIYAGDGDAYVAKVVESDGGAYLDYAGYIGGPNSEYGNGIAVDSAGNAYVTGSTSSTEATFPVVGGPDMTYNGLTDAFVAKVKVDGTGLAYAGYIGGSGSDTGTEIAVDSAGNAYVTGYTDSTQVTFPVVGGPDLTYNGGGSDVFVSKVKTDGAGLIYAGYIGGSTGDTGSGIAVDSAGNAYVTGYTDSTEATFPVVGGPDVSYNGGPLDVLVAKIQYIPIDLDVNVTTLTFAPILEDRPNPPPLSFTILDNNGNEDLLWTISTDVPWLSLSYALPNVLPATIKVEAALGSLEPGTYNGVITVTSEGQTKTINVTATVLPGDQPWLQANPTQLSFEAASGGPPPPSDSLVIHNLGAGELTWTASETIPWLSLGQSSGTASDSPAIIEVTVDPASLEPGAYEGQITVTSPGAYDSPQIVNVALTIIPPPQLRVSANQLNFNAFVEQGNPKDQYFSVSNGGSGTLNWTVSETVPWLKVSPTAGSGSGRVLVSVDAAGLDRGTYSGQIAVASPGAQDSPRTIKVQLRVDTTRQLYLLASKLDFNLVEGANPPAQTLSFGNKGKGSFKWQASANVDWLKLSATSGTAGSQAQTISVSVDAGKLAVGKHAGLITLSSSDDIHGIPQTVNVLVAVASKDAPGCLEPKFTIIESAQVNLTLDVTSATPKAPAGCDISGTMTLKIPQNTLKVTFQGQINAQNKLDLKAPQEITLAIAKVKLKLSNIRIDNNGLTANGVWLLSAIKGGSKGTGLVRIDRKGISIDGKQSFPLAVSLKLEGFAFSSKQATLYVTSSAAAFQLDLAGTITLKIPGSPVKLDIVATLSKKGVTVKSGKSVAIPNFNVSVAGLGLKVTGAKFGQLKKNGPWTVFAKAATLKIPPQWGGLSQTVSQITVDKSGKLSIGGGSFKLPPLKAGSFTLGSLEGSLKKSGNGYEISADGEFQITAATAGKCGLQVGVTLYQGPGGASVLEIDSQQPAGSGPIATVSTAADHASANALNLRRVKFGLWNCAPGIPIGSSPLYLTGVRGTITLQAKMQSFKVEFQLQTSQLKVNNTALIYSEAGATLNRSTKGKLSMDFEGFIKIIGVQAAKTKVSIDDRRLEATLSFEYMIIHGSFKTIVGRSKSGNKFIATGSGKANIRVRKGAIAEQCLDLQFKKVCASFPPSDWQSPSVNADFGTFSDGAIGFKGYVQYSNFGAGFYVDTKGRTAFGNVDQYRLANSQVIQQARLNQQLGARVPADSPFTFRPNGDVSLTVPVFPRIAGRPTGEAQFNIPPSSDVVFVLAQPLTGTVQLSLEDPSGDPLTPENLPGNAEYTEVVSEAGLQRLYVVRQADPGNWQAVVSGDSGNADYLVAVFINVPPPVLSDLSLSATANPDQLQLKWKLISPDPDTKINVYATSDPVTATIVITEPNNMTSTSTISQYTGILVAEEIPSNTGGTLQSHLLDISQLPSDVYSFWIEAQDSRNGPTRGYLHQGGQVAKVTIDRSNSFPTTWQPNITAIGDPQNLAMAVEWSLNEYPDMDSYLLNLRTSNPIFPTEVLTQQVAVSANTEGVMGSAQVWGIEPGHPYHLSICAEDEKTRQMVCTEEREITSPQPDFIITGPDTLQQVEAGQEITVPITLDISEELPYPVSLQPDYELLADGFDVVFDQELITTKNRAQVMAYIRAEEAMFRGDYLVPIVVNSGGLERTLNMSVRVLVEEEPELKTGVYLPLITKDAGGGVDEHGADLNLDGKKP